MKKQRIIASLLLATLAAPMAFAASSSGIVERVYIAPGTGAVARQYIDKFKEQPTVNDYGAKGDGVTDDSAALTKSLAAVGSAYLPAGYVYKVQAVTLGTGQRILGQGKLKGFSGTTMVSVTGDNATISGISVDAAGATYAIVLSAKRGKVDHVSFSGNVGHYVLASGADAPQVVDSTFDGSTATGIITSVVIDNTTNFKVADNRFFDTLGFGVQVRNNSYYGQVAYNTFKQPQTTATATATAGQTVFSFTLSRPVARYGVQVNGVPTVAGVGISTTDSTTFTVTLPTGRTAGDVVKFIGYRALENVNINSRVYDVQVIGNDIDGTGDSGIVMGADYHNGVLDPNNVTTADYPARITVQANKVKNAGYAGIAQTHAAPDCEINGNIVQDNAQIADDYSYSSAILASGPNTAVRNNHISNTLSPATMKFGIINNEFATSDGSTVASQRFSQNSFTGTFLNKYLMTNQTPGQRHQSVMIEDGQIVEYPAKIDLDTTFSSKPADTPYFTYSNLGAGWSYDTTNKVGGTASLGTIAGAYVNIGLPSVPLFAGMILKVDFMAKANSGTSYVQVFSNLAGSPSAVTVNITATSWKPYTIYMPMFDIDPTSVFLRIGSNSGTANVQNIRIAGVRVP